MNWNRPINIDRELVAAIGMGVLLAWIAGLLPACIDALQGDWRLGYFSTWHVVIAMISGAGGLACGCLSLPFVVPVLRLRSFHAAFWTIYGPALAIDVLAAFIWREEGGLGLRAVGVVAITMLLSSGCALLFLPRWKREIEQ